MKIYTNTANTNRPIIEDLAKFVADTFNEDIKDGDFAGWEDYVSHSYMSSSDIKEAIIDLVVYFIRFIWQEDPNSHKSSYSITENGTVYVGNDEYSYNKFKNIIMKYVIHNGDDQDNT